jgi:glycerate 2-kinase
MKGKQINILIAPNSMKGSMNAVQFADVVEEAFLQVSSLFNIKKIPVADGGDYTGEILRLALHATLKKTRVNDPLGRLIESKYAVTGKIAVIEMADASGMKYMKTEELNPLITSSFGTGQLILKAFEEGCTEIWLGAGGSATVDGGSGILEALGFQLLDANDLPLVANGMNIGKITSIIKPEILPEVTFKIITDVDNPLLGETGAAKVFGPQKGATPEMVPVLEENLTIWCRLLEKNCGKNLSSIKGSGAAGGLALPLLAFFDAELVPGAEFILKALEFDKYVGWADIIITGEGKIDSQTLHNKAPKAVSDYARKAGKPVIAIGGAVETGATDIFDGGVFSFIPKPVLLEDSIVNAKKYLFDFSVELAKTISRIG